MKIGYTPVNVQIWLSLNNSYSQRFYDLLRLWSGTKDIVNYKVEEIKELLMLDDKYISIMILKEVLYFQL